MALDRWIAFVILCVALAYAYAAFFTMDHLLPPFMQRNPIWPSTFPKVLSVLAILTALVILLGLEKAPESDKAPDIDYRRLPDYHLVPALALLALMAAYALLLRPAGFLLATAGFLTLGGAILGERKFHILLPVAGLATGVVWYLVEQVLGIFLRPLPFFL
ncbi:MULTISPECIES: tripartite tricarboxylate transporter TctB family protein [Marinovum]|uniref:tripartite tricarboxylate transporter TctB family protein n=1 Tax=Marinovum TaxID=367771 RepID=UPI00065B2F68|nr:MULTISPECIES: tripartite tricarboxylate transporter TctB family protein [Marinovum]AKO98498.1 Tripartite tricarboxylate transporter [Marinovum algicola DG 898]MDD9741374.1 tripartite tricarboxylate transporter TctB family protein [Marinovum sp. SP66]